MNHVMPQREKSRKIIAAEKAKASKDRKVCQESRYKQQVRPASNQKTKSPPNGTQNIQEPKQTTIERPRFGEKESPYSAIYTETSFCSFKSVGF